LDIIFYKDNLLFHMAWVLMINGSTQQLGRIIRRSRINLVRQPADWTKTRWFSYMCFQWFKATLYGKCCRESCVRR